MGTFPWQNDAQLLASLGQGDTFPVFLEHLSTCSSVVNSRHTIFAQNLLLEHLWTQISFSRSLDNGSDDIQGGGTLGWQEEEGVDTQLYASAEETEVNRTCG